MPECHASALKIWVGRFTGWHVAADEVQQLYILGFAMKCSAGLSDVPQWSAHVCQCMMLL